MILSIPFQRLLTTSPTFTKRTCGFHAQLVKLELLRLTDMTGTKINRCQELCHSKIDIIRDRLEILLLILSEFKRIN